MSRWLYTVKIKHLMTEDETRAGVQRDMNAIADALEKEPCFREFNAAQLSNFRNIPKGDDMFGPVDYANLLLERMYNYADRNGIWIG
jgi:hypothetical protein